MPENDWHQQENQGAIKGSANLIYNNRLKSGADASRTLADNLFLECSC